MKTKARTQPKYPWVVWTDGRLHTIYKGEDYDISTYNMQISLHGRARHQKLKVQTSSFSDNGTEGLVFRFKENHERECETVD